MTYLSENSEDKRQDDPGRRIIGVGDSDEGLEKRQDEVAEWPKSVAPVSPPPEDPPQQEPSSQSSQSGGENSTED